MSYDNIIRQGSNKKKTIYSGFTDIVEKRVSKKEIEKPTPEEEEEATAKTRGALQKLIDGKIKAAKPVQVPGQAKNDPTYVKYTANPNAPGYNPSVGQVCTNVKDSAIPAEEKL